MGISWPINSTLSIAWVALRRLHRSWTGEEVYLQGVPDARMSPEDLQKWYVRNDAGEMVPFSAFASGEWTYGSPKLSVTTASARSRCSASRRPATARVMPWPRWSASPLSCRRGGLWTGQSYEERLAGSQTLALYALSLLVVFLCRLREAGRFRSRSCWWCRWHRRRAFAAAGFQRGVLRWAGHWSVARNAILIVEFAKALHEQGMSHVDAALQACRMRLRPIIMTSLAFILGGRWRASGRWRGQARHRYWRDRRDDLRCGAGDFLDSVVLRDDLHIFDRTKPANEGVKEDSL